MAFIYIIVNIVYCKVNDVLCVWIVMDNLMEYKSSTIDLCCELINYGMIGEYEFLMLICMQVLITWEFLYLGKTLSKFQQKHYWYIKYKNYETSKFHGLWDYYRMYMHKSMTLFSWVQGLKLFFFCTLEFTGCYNPSHGLAWN
jgi:hypothetical protein